MKDSSTPKQEEENLSDSQRKLAVLRENLNQFLEITAVIEDSIDSCLPVKDLSSLPPQDLNLWSSEISNRKIIDTCHARRMQMIGLLLTQQQTVSSLKTLSEVYLSDSVLEQISGNSVINHGAGGLVFSRIGEYLVFLLPQVVESVHWEEINCELDRIAADPAEKLNWLFDFSAIEYQPPLRMILGLIAHKEGLAKKGTTLNIAWLRDGLLPPSVYRRFEPLFNLELVGGNWFSRNC